MKKILVGDCPKCGAKIEITLSRIFGRPIGLPKECPRCKSRLKISPEKPFEAKAVGVGSYVGLFATFWYFERSLVATVACVLAYILIIYLIGKTYGRPILTLYTPDRDFLKEELKCDETFPDKLFSLNNQRSNKSEEPTPNPPSD